ncbi:hypothetical protein KAM334_27430 [Aeromonas caviae]|nr:hypothetical protein KAM334_27430 [Aeromonas caviae]
MRGGGFGIGDDVVVFKAQIVKGGAPEAVDGDRRHVSQDSLEGPLVLDLVLKIFDRADGARWRQALLGYFLVSRGWGHWPSPLAGWSMAALKGEGWDSPLASIKKPGSDTGLGGRAVL